MSGTEPRARRPHTRLAQAVLWHEFRATGDDALYKAAIFLALLDIQTGADDLDRVAARLERWTDPSYLGHLAEERRKGE